MIDLTLEYPTPSSQAPASSSARSEASEWDAEGSYASSSLKWYKKVNKYNGRSGHPYDPSEPALRYEDVQFWPYVGPLNPWKPPKGIDGDWEEYDGTVALCTQRKIVVGRCTDSNPWRVLWEMDIDDYLYTLAWTYQSFTCHPLLVAAGSKGLIYVIDALSKRCLRVLRGHGGAVLRLASHPSHPHIIASTSYDTSTRIWNILGSDVPPLLPGERYNENFPMGDADEGNCLVAILVGEGRGGHRGYVADAAFHPTKNAMATAGLDRQVKIWPLPELPKASIKPIPTPRGYRAKLIHLPLFSTSRLHADFVDNIEWLNEYTLMSRARQEVKIWEWTGFSRFFRPGDPHPKIMEPCSDDHTDSGSFTTISVYPFGSDCWAMNASFHRQFSPSLQESEYLEKREYLVTDPLVALVAHRTGSLLPEILLFNPLLAEDGDPPSPTKEKRAGSRRDSTSSSDGESEDDSSANISLDSESRAATQSEEGDETSSMDEWRPGSRPGASRPTSYKTVDGERKENGSSTSSTSAEGKGPNGPRRNQSLEPWRLVATDYQALVRLQSRKGVRLFADGTNLCNVAISPRGAEWILGVGQPCTVFVWKIDM
uniref:Polycomb protein EED n=1 Tax=Kwoniella dejecticola CBS 10117 TaxID=1296121 RepID=A0A1A5ZX01_9TREE|nr:uncharacterized protein I303_07094 [Kwoniella dejecticola CBS 10117]OBR82335.1 hypothetical protein I303_07094 [Kwoniella dejecticola CBS 10117]